MVYYPGVVAAAGDGGAAFTPRYADFASDYGVRGGALTGVVDGKVGILSLFAIFDSLGAAQRTIFTGSTALRFVIQWLDSPQVFRIRSDTAGGTAALQLRVSSALATGTPYHILMSWNLATAGTGRVYVNDASAKTETTYTNLTLDYTDTNYACGASVGGTLNFDGRLGEFYLNLASYLDFDVTANRRKFISAAGAPVDLGTDGSTPTGSAPAVYFSLRPADSPNAFLTNRGAGGAFSITGALADGGAI